MNYIFSKKDKLKTLLILCGIIMGSFLELMGVAVFSPFVNVLMNPDSIQETWYLKWLYDLFHFSSINYFLASLTGVIIFIYIFKNIFLALQKNWIYKFSYGIQLKLSTRLLKTYVKEPYTFHLSHNIAVLQRSLQEDTDLFTKGIIHAMELVAEIAVCGTLGIYLMKVSVSIASSVVVLLVFSLLIFTSISRRYSKNLGKQCQQYKSNLYQWVNQSLGGIKELKILNREEYFINAYEDNYKKYVHGLRINRLIASMPKYFVEAVCMTGLLVAILIKMFWGQKEDFTAFIPQLSVFAVAAFRLLPSVGKINEHVADILYSLPSLDLIYHDLKAIEEEPEVKEKEEMDWEFKKEISISNVCYHYPDGEDMVINKASFIIPKGKTVAFIGPSGAGKTTIVDIILGLLKPQFGKVKADELNIHKHPYVWQKEIGYIPQVIYLSDDTIRNNIAFGIRKEEIDDQAILQALKKAQLYEFVENLPEGLDTMVGDRGVRLSGGQRQRIGIARALYHDPEVLVLDEATSALDNETEAAVMEAIDHLQGMKTILIIAHRLTTIRNVDMIYEVSNGKVELKAKEEVFPDMKEEQV
ncbi:MAG: ABC transporter ATP-binding protein [Firmicutes bacterium]|nr:ABC transporter ATP-binding protein [Bacillota bacterium]